MNYFDDEKLWREAVADWAMKVTACADDGDRKAKGMMVSLVLTLYYSLAMGAKEQIKLSFRRDKNVLKPSTEDSELSQVQMVYKIVKIVA